MQRLIFFIGIVLAPFFIANPGMQSAKPAGVSVLDRDYLAVNLIEGEVLFKDDGKGAHAYRGAENDADDNRVEKYGILNVNEAMKTAQWTILSSDDPAYQDKGKNPSQVFRKSKINGMAQLDWNTAANDFNYETPMGHVFYLKLPVPLQEGKHYTLVIGSSILPEERSENFAFNTSQRSDAIHLNLCGYMDAPAIKSADVYQWLGDGGARDYSSFEGNKVFVYNVSTGMKSEVGDLKLFHKKGKDVGGYDISGSDVWTADFTSLDKPGIYKIVIDGIGASQNFKIARGIYENPFKVSIRGFYYMRIGEAERKEIRPVPRQPLYIPKKSPPETRVFITSMQPYHPEWKTFASGDQWDKPEAFERFVKEGRPENQKAYGGHSDAADWDRHLGHVSIIYDMLLPYMLTKGAISDDNAGIPESSNGIPDILDEARNEVDFWLRLRDGEGYSHGLTNPTSNSVLYQAGTTVVAAWANAANAAMLAECYRIGGFLDLSQQYLALAQTAYHYAEKAREQQLDKAQDVGDAIMRGADFKITAAACLFNLTGDPAYEKTINELSVVVNEDSDAGAKPNEQIWATAAYLLTPQKVGFSNLYERMKKSIINAATNMEVKYSQLRPSRRSTDEQFGYFYTAQNVQRTMLAHCISTDLAEKQKFLDALVLEADWGLGRNPLNIILMTTATTPLASLRSIENIYTTGRNDGTPGLHPGHTPYLNMDDWAPNMIMGKPGWMAAKDYPAASLWPRGECYYNTRYVWAHSEFTPQQTMRGKAALYGYLYGINHRAAAPAPVSPGRGTTTPGRGIDMPGRGIDMPGRGGRRG
jgi:endoglucanase